MPPVMDIPTSDANSSQQSRVNRYGRSYPAFYDGGMAIDTYDDDSGDLADSDSDSLSAGNDSHEVSATVIVLAEMREVAQREFASVFEASVATARSADVTHRQDLERWIEAGGLAEFLSLCIDANPAAGGVACAAAETVYQRE
jgi:hypothetical protein